VTRSRRAMSPPIGRVATGAVCKSAPGQSAESDSATLRGRHGHPGSLPAGPALTAVRSRVLTDAHQVVTSSLSCVAVRMIGHGIGHGSTDSNLQAPGPSLPAL